MLKTITAAMLMLFGAFAIVSASETVVLKGGKTLELSKPYVIRGSQALMTLKDGTLISVAAADIDTAATRAARRARPVPAQPTGPLSPAEAAKAQKAHAKARVKIGDDDVGHVLDTGETQPSAADEAAAESEQGARLEVVDFDQRPSGDTLNVKGTLRNSGKAVAENIALSVSAIDAAGKAVATANAIVAAGSLESGSTASFTAALPTAVKASTLRFTPRWSGAASVAKPEGATAPGAGRPGAVATLPAPAKPAPPPPPPPAEPKSTYKPQPDYAPPAANAPMTAPDDNHTGYIPGAHEETPPPPPPPRSE
jgi:hypothetical protein